MKISFIVPVYNLEGYINECISSIVKQNYTSYEIILIDDGSTDETPQICDEMAFENRFIKVIHQNNLGVSMARNRGLQEASGEFICFVDGDDWLECDFCSLIQNYLKEDIEIYFFGHYIVKNNKKKKINNFCKDSTIFVKKDFEWLQKCILNRYINKTNAALGQPWGKIYKRTFLEKQQVKYIEGIPLSEDLLFNLNTFNVAEKGIYINESLYNYRIRNNAATKKYRENTPAIFLHQMSYIKQFLEVSDNYQILEQDFYIRNIMNIMYCIILDFCHEENKKSYAYRKQQFLLFREVDIIQESIAHTKMNSFPLVPKIVYFIIKYKIFWILNLICKLYN